MSTSTDNDTPRPASQEDYEAEQERLFAMGEQATRASDGDIGETELKTLASSLISLYDNTFNRARLRERAADVVKNLAIQYDSVLDLVVLKARGYARTQHIDDAFPYHPNAFDVLAGTGNRNKKVIPFLRDVIRKDWGIPRWDAIGALCRIDDTDAEETIVDVIRGKYPSRNPDVRNDMREIERVKGKSFVEQHKVRIVSTGGSPNEVETEVRIGSLRATICPEDIYVLTSRDDAGITTAVVAPAWGANVLGMSFQANDWALPVPVLESADIATIAAKPTSYGVPILAPTPGRVGHNQNGRFRFDGKDYSVRPGRHGFLRNLAWTVISQSATSITCVVDVFPSQIAATSDAFPFEFRAEYQVEVTSGRLRCRLRICNTSKRVQPIAVGWHPYLHRTGECVVCLPARGRWELDQEREPTPTGRILEVSPDDDFREGRAVETDEHWDDVFTDLIYDGGVASCWVEETAPLLLKEGSCAPTRIRRTVSLIASSGQDGPRMIENVQLFTPPGRSAITIEPLSSPPNAINLLDHAHERAHVCELPQNKDVVHEIVIGLEATPA